MVFLRLTIKIGLVLLCCVLSSHAQILVKGASKNKKRVVVSGVGNLIEGDTLSHIDEFEDECLAKVIHLLKKKKELLAIIDTSSCANRGDIGEGAIFQRKNNVFSRSFYFNVRFFSSLANASIGSVSETSSISKFAIGLSKNNGFFGFGGFITGEKTEESSSTAKSIHGTLFLIENKSGNYLIPFIEVSLAQIEREEEGIEGNIELSGIGQSFEVGVTFFPTQQDYFGITLSYGVVSVPFKVKDTSETLETNASGFGISLVGYF